MEDYFSQANQVDYFTEALGYSGPERRSKPRVAEGFLDAIQAGYQGSATGLALRGRLPDVVLDESHSKWYESLAATASQMVSELPEMAVGAAIGGVAGTAIGPGYGNAIGAGAGSFAIPTAIRESLMQAYEARDVQTSGEWLSRAGIVIKHTLKDAVIGGASFGIGKYVGGTKLAKVLGPTATDIATQTGVFGVAPALLDGRLPEPQDFTNAAIMVAGGKAAGHVASKMRLIFAKTGIRPEQQVQDAMNDPKLREEILKPPVSEKPVGETQKPVSVSGETQKTEAPIEGLSYNWIDEIPTAYKERAVDQIGRSIIPGEEAKKTASTPFVEYADVPTVKVVGEPNMDMISGSDDIKIAVAQSMKDNKARVETQRRGVQHEQDSWDGAEKMLRLIADGEDPIDVMNRIPGSAANAEELLARGSLFMTAAKNVAESQKAYDAKVEAGTVTPKDIIDHEIVIEKLHLLLAEFMGSRAEVARAQNANKFLKEATAYAEVAQSILDRYGTDAKNFGKMFSDATAEGIITTSKLLRKATTWEMVMEAWKAGLVSGPITQIANMVGNTTFTMIRVPIDLLAGAIRTVRTGEGAHMGEAVAGVYGMIEGTMTGLRAGIDIMKNEQLAYTKSESLKPAIPGRAGEIVRHSFRWLAAVDAVFKAINHSAETNRIAFREAMKAGLDPHSREFREKIAEVRQRPDVLEAGRLAADRFTFTAPLGPAGRGIQKFSKDVPLFQIVAPFIQTPANVAKELIRMSVFAPFTKQWRAEARAGGAVSDKAWAELVFGSLVAGAVSGLVVSGKALISGAGDPDPTKRATDLATGWQPYSVKIGNKWYSYQRLQPVGTLVGMAADMAEVWEHMTPEESDKIPKMLAVAFANSITNQTFLQGVSNIIGATTDPERYGPTFIERLASSVVPGIIAQPAQLTDPLLREINSSLDAIKNRIPGLRQTLLPKRDIFGVPVENKERLGVISPITVTEATDDLVRNEASRLRVGVAKAPSDIELPAAKNRKLGKVELTPEQQDVFSDVSGHLAYQILSPIVHNPNWKNTPDIIQKRIYDLVFQKARQVGAIKAVSIEQRIQESQRIAAEIQKQLNKEKSE